MEIYQKLDTLTVKVIGAHHFFTIPLFWTFWRVKNIGVPVLELVLEFRCML